MPANTARGLLSSRANQVGTFMPSIVSYSLKLVTGTRQRCSGPSQRRQCGDFTFRMFVTPGSVLRPSKTNCGDGIPQRAIASSRSPSAAFRTMGAEVSGKTPGSEGRLPVVSRIARVNSRAAVWLLVMLYRLHMTHHVASMNDKCMPSSAIIHSQKPKVDKC